MHTMQSVGQDPKHILSLEKIVGGKAENLLLLRRYPSFCRAAMSLHGQLGHGVPSNYRYPEPQLFEDNHGQEGCTSQGQADKSQICMAL